MAPGGKAPASDTATAADRAAASWLVHREDGELSAVEAEAFERWLQADPRHREALGRMERFWHAFDEPAAETVTEPAPAEPRRNWRLPAGLAAAAMLVLAIGIGLVLNGGSEAYYSTGHELRTVVLEDGSRITLDAQTRLSASMHTTGRDIELLTGKARFEVSPDPARPFTVHAGAVHAQALGTVFDVDRRANAAVSVSVLEGRVQVVSTAPGQEPRTHLSSTGDTVVWRRNGEPELNSDQNIDVIGQWAEGRLVFRGEPAGTALKQVNRYEPKPLQLPPAVSPSTPVYGVFRAGDGAAFLNALVAGTDD
ncbi:FecR family protein [Lentisalinibacter sediminis]|uniref:FecR family protein n=1 Tax=Lentisalinibacter sediminis TaxID=2992237 RepID=UPI00386DBC81